MQSAPATERLPVLVVDDDSALIRTLSDILRLNGYAPETAATGGDGLRLLERVTPALAIVDLRLPDMDGMELISRIHEMSALTEVVVLTGNASLESAVAAMRERSVDYLVKPVQVDELLRLASQASDRWQRRMVEDKLREANDRFRAVVESDLLGIMFFDLDGRIVDANDAFLRMVGYTRDDLEAGGMNWAHMTPPEWVARDAEKARELVERSSIAPYEKEYVRKDGTRVPILVGASMLERHKNRGVGFFLDITGRKRAERALEERARQQAAVADFGQHTLRVGDLDVLFDDATALVSRTLSLPYAAVLERRSDGASAVVRSCVGWDASWVGRSVLNLDEDTQAGFTMATAQPAVVPSFSLEQPFPGSRVLREEGIRSGVTVPIPASQRVFGILEAHGREAREFSRDDVHFLQAIAHVLGSAVDRHRAEAGMRQSQRMEAVGQLAGGVAHDFNNMLTAISGYAQLVQDALPKDSEQRADVEEILRASARASALTRQLLAFSRQQVLQLRPVNLNDVLTQLDGMLRRLITENVTFRFALEPALGPVRADPTQLEQVILNLCVNARDAMPKGGTLSLETANVELDASRPREPHSTATGSYVMLAVTDTGTGMDAETRSRVFEPFFTTKGPEHGTGLGLATVYGIVKQSGGEIWVYSELGHGTTFKVYLPRIAGEAEAAAPSAAPPPAAATRGHETVLVAEDEASIRRLTERVLSEAGYTVLLAENGDDALRQAGAHTGDIDLLITDMLMPERDGRSLADQLRSLRPGLRVLYVSGYTALSAQRKGLLPEGAEFLEKPFSSDALVSRVRAVLDAPRRESERAR